jgi:DNA-binding transcriptional LysR family regulator
VDFGQNEADGEIRYIRSWNPYDPPPGVRTLEFDRPAIFPVASPDFLAKMERPLKHISDLANVQLIHEEDDEEWRRWLHAHHVVVDAPLKGSRLWHANLSIDAAIEGQGIALVNDRLVRDLIGAGRLQRVTFTNEPVCHVELGGYTLIARIDRWNSTSLARFRDWLGTNINSVK